MPGTSYGAAKKEWRSVDVPKHEIVLRFDGKEIARGTGAAILGGDPLATVVLLANNQPKDSEGLRAGQIITTGSCAGAHADPGRRRGRRRFRVAG